ncbi:MAG: hypothetical protein IPP90_03575 [Gemmatimonadaceae bacterium]|nr:hypothetical protein [Gemmatimonadaceae bacterium]
MGTHRHHSPVARPARAFALALLLSLAGACGDDSPLAPQRAELAAARARWTSARPASNSYTMEQRVSCFCVTGATNFEVTVAAGTIVRARSLETGVEMRSAQFTMFRAVDQLFEEIRLALGVPGTLNSVEFDPATGYPTTVALDPIKQAVDDEVTYVTRHLTFVP